MTRWKFGWIWDGSWTDFWWIMAPSWEASWVKLALEWCQNGVQDGLLGIRAVKKRSWTDTPTVSPIHGAVLGGLLGSCWGSCWAHVGVFFRDDILMPFGRRFGPRDGRNPRPTSSPRHSPRRPNFGLGNRCQKRSKINSFRCLMISECVACLTQLCCDTGPSTLHLDARMHAQININCSTIPFFENKKPILETMGK